MASQINFHILWGIQSIKFCIVAVKACIKNDNPVHMFPANVGFGKGQHAQSYPSHALSYSTFCRLGAQNRFFITYCNNPFRLYR